MSELDTYPAPLDRLHVLGLDESDYPARIDYRALGIGPEHIPALIAIATDRRPPIRNGGAPRGVGPAPRVARVR
jgi:hypothetical protein